MEALGGAGGVRPRARRAGTDARALDHHLPGWDYADAFAVDVGGDGPADALTAARCLFGLSPRGRRVLRARDRVARLARLRPTARAGADLFPVLHASPDLAVVGLDDRHLDFRVLVDVAPGRVRATTAVRRHGGLGAGYFAVVGPFHRRIVPRMLERAARRRWRTSSDAVHG